MVHAGAEAVFIDGGNTFDPYALAQFAQCEGAPSREVLSRIQVARAFTAHQLCALIEETLPELVAAHQPALLVVDEIVRLFYDDDVAWKEAQSRFEQALVALRKLTAAEELITLLTASVHDKRGSSVRSRALQRLLRKAGDGRDGLVLIEPALTDAGAKRRYRRRHRYLYRNRTARNPFRRSSGTYPVRVRVDGTSIVYCPLPPGQATLAQFGVPYSAQDET